jgi:hypothetical protein
MDEQIFFRVSHRFIALYTLRPVAIKKRDKRTDKTLFPVTSYATEKVAYKSSTFTSAYNKRAPILSCILA